MDKVLKQDNLYAYMWFNFAESPGANHPTTGDKDRIAELLSPDQIKAVQKLRP